jgi:hypothetical protein
MNHILLRDGNGDPIPDFLWVIPLLGDGYGVNLIPTGILMVQTHSSIGSSGVRYGYPLPIPVTHPVKRIVYHVSVTVYAWQAQPMTQMASPRPNM